jgi:catechol 2,3-dioxygenase-like lactoylglutathione lyase family enzyme
MAAAIKTSSAPAVDMKLEVVVIPVSDVDRAKQFYAGLGWRLDADFASGGDWRVIQVTPPGSPASVIFGKNVTAAKPGSAQGLYLIVSDIEAARNALIARGVEVSDVFHAGGKHAGTDEPYISGRARVNGPDPDHGSYGSFASFQGSRRQWLAVPGGHRTIARACRWQHHVPLLGRARERAAPCSGRAWRAREAQRRPARCELAGLVRRIHRQ